MNKSNQEKNIKIIAQNKKAFHDYEILERLEAGIVLLGSEVKSIRKGEISLADSYVLYENGEMFVHHMHINPFQQKGFTVPVPYRKRKLLLHASQIKWLASEVERKNLTIIPLKVYFDKKHVKLEIGLCRGLKKFDKREKIAKEEEKKRLEQIMKIRGKR
jgi:SsrA-binding protein